MCGGYTCSKNTLMGLNIIYVMVSFLLIGVATYGKTSNQVTSLPLLGGIVASGVFLLFVAVLGLVATLKHNQVWLFFYMVILSFIFLIQFSVACACIGFSEEREKAIVTTAWGGLDNSTKIDVEKVFGCCGLTKDDRTGDEMSECLDKVPACKSVNNVTLSCPGCLEEIGDKIDYAFNASGGVGLFFAFAEVIGVIVAYRYRNMAAPSAPGELFQ